jgi:hypothetical protein
MIEIIIALFIIPLIIVLAGTVVMWMMSFLLLTFAGITGWVYDFVTRKKS